MKDLAADAAVLRYEVGMLVQAHAWIIKNYTDPPDLLSNSMLEVFCLHARNLMEFVLPLRASIDTIAMADFFDSEGSEDSVEARRLRRDRPELHKRVAHMSRSRHKAFDGWAITVLAGDLMILLGRFLDRVSSEAGAAGAAGAAVMKDIRRLVDSFWKEMNDRYEANMAELNR